MKIIVLGAGLVGSPMAFDLASDPNFEVTVADISASALGKLASYGNISTQCIDLSDPETVKEVVSPYDLVLDAVPGFMGYQTYKAVIEAGKNIVDIAFFPEDPMALDQLAKDMGVTAIMDMGVAPGMSNVLSAYGASKVEEVDLLRIYVGGLPRIRTRPFEYKAVFSPIDVIEEYTRPARIVQEGKLVIKPALSEPEFMEFEGVGTLEAFNSDGLRSLAYTIKGYDMAEKTLRYPGHIFIMEILRETGFFSYNEINVKGKMIRPIDVTSHLLFPAWKLMPGEEDLTVMKIIVEGPAVGVKMRITYDLLDTYDTQSGVHSMARTTGYSATAAIRMLASGIYKEKGVILPEYLGNVPACVDFLLKELKKRGVVYTERIEPL
ncbi:MAG: saccharopine dehydrogenase C-terminal domain-containing protein [Bacteroidota bacterium]